MASEKQDGSYGDMWGEGRVVVMKTYLLANRMGVTK